jgi:hypothetical protein
MFMNAGNILTLADSIGQEELLEGCLLPLVESLREEFPNSDVLKNLEFTIKENEQNC